MQDILFPKPKLHLFVCINDRSHIPNSDKPSCGPTITSEMVKEVKLWVREQGWTSQVYVTKAQCLGFCNAEGGVACAYPQGRFVKGLHSMEDIKNFVKQAIGDKK